jgi:peptidoglycan/xylan/chitin deacetylase (PgdA/CDA1 family)
MITLKQQLKKIAVRFLTSIFNKPGPVSLMYHSVSNGGHKLSITPGQLDEQIRYLKEKKYHFLRLEDLKTPSILSAKSVLITFDDGLEDIYLNAIPILKKHTVPAIFFIVTGLVGKKYIKPEFNCMTWDQIKEISKNTLFEIGCHTLSHPHLDTLSFQEQNSEIFGSKKILEDNLGKKIRSFAAPYGCYNAATLNIIKEIGIKYAFSVEQGFIDSKTNLLEIPRIGVDGINSEYFPDILKKGYGIYWNLYYRFFPNRRHWKSPVNR